jgi:hypothetical protein
MKTEHEIAKENIEIYRDMKEEENLGYTNAPLMLIHKQTCQRWLEFLEKECNIDYKDRREAHSSGFGKEFNKITDLKQTIKEYEDNGI